MRAAVYKITNTVNGKLYIGLSANPTKRWWEHRNQTRKTHTKLYNAFRKYGVEAFSFDVLHWCDSQEDARDLENLVVDVCEAVTKGYNMCPGGGGGIAGPDSPFYGKPLPPEVRAKMSEAAKRRAPNPEAREKAAAKMRGRKQPSEQVEKRAAKKRGVPHTETHKANLSAAWVGRRKNHPVTEETRRKLSKRMTEIRAKALKKVLCVNTGVIYVSIKHAADAFGLTTRGIGYLCRTEGAKSKTGHIFRYV